MNAGANLEARTLEDEFPLYLAAYSGSVPIVKELIARGVDIDRENRREASSLYVVRVLFSPKACRKGNEAVVKVLIESGASMNPLATLTAARNGHTECLKILVRLV